MVDKFDSVKYVDRPMADTETPHQRLATVILGRPVRDWIADQRALGHTWRHIATALSLETDGQVVVSHEAVRGWFEEVAA